MLAQAGEDIIIQQNHFQLSNGANNIKNLFK